MSNVLQHIPDYHVHTRFSRDSETALAAACEAAIARGLRGDADRATDKYILITLAAGDSAFGAG